MLGLKPMAFEPQVFKPLIWDYSTFSLFLFYTGTETEGAEGTRRAAAQGRGGEERGALHEPQADTRGTEESIHEGERSG